MITLPVWAYGLITSTVYIVAVLVARAVLVRMVQRNSEVLSKEQRRWVNRVRNGAWAAIMIGLIMIWSTQLHTFALSLTAFAVAFVVATKEMILCLMGSLFRVSTQPYKVGDWIVIDNIQGEVTEINAFTTRMQQIEPSFAGNQFTGRSISIPNARLFTSNVENINFVKNYIFRDFSVAVQAGSDDPSVLVSMFREIVDRHTAPGREDAQKFLRRAERRNGVDFPSADPQFSLKTTDLGHVTFWARIFAPANEAPGIMAKITEEFLCEVYKRKVAMQEEKDEKKEEQGD